LPHFAFLSFILTIGQAQAHTTQVASIAVPTPPVTVRSGNPGFVSEHGLERSQLVREFVDGKSEIPTVVPGGLPADYMDAMRLDEAIAMALSHNFEIRAAESKKNATKWQVFGAYGQYAPQLTYTYAVGSERNLPASYNDSTGKRVEDSKHHRRDRVLKIQQPIIDVSVIADILKRRVNDDIADVQRVSTRERVAMDTLKSYFGILQAVLTIKAAEAYKASLDSLLNRMETRVAGGGSAKADLERLRSRSVSAKSSIISAQSELQSAQMTFRRYTGVIPTEIKIPARWVPEIPEQPAEALAKALTENPDYQVSALQEDVAQMESHKTFGGLVPKVSLELSRTTTYGAGGSDRGNPIDGGPWDYEREDSAMLVMTWHLNGGSDIANGISYRSSMKEAQYKTMDLRLRMEETMQDSYTALNAAGQRIQATRAGLKSDEIVVKSFEQQFFAASRPLFDLLDAHERLYESRVSLIRLLSSEARAAYQVRLQMGELVGAVMNSEDAR